MRAAGISIPRIALPVLILAGIGVALGIRVNFDSMPRAKVQYERELVSAMRSNPLNFIVAEEIHTRLSRLRDLHRARSRTAGPKGRLGLAARRGPPAAPPDPRRSGRVEYDEATNALVVPLTNVREEEPRPKEAGGLLPAADGQLGRPGRPDPALAGKVLRGPYGPPEAPVDDLRRAERRKSPPPFGAGRPRGRPPAGPRRHEGFPHRPGQVQHGRSPSSPSPLSRSRSGSRCPGARRAPTSASLSPSPSAITF